MKLFFVFIFIFVLAKTSVARADSINIAWYYNCPWMCNQDKKPGFLAELLVEVFKLSNIEVQFQKSSRPLALHEVKKGRALALISPSKDEAIGFYFPKENLGFQQMCFYVKKESNWSYKNFDSLDDVVFGIS